MHVEKGDENMEVSIKSPWTLDTLQKHHKSLLDQINKDIDNFRREVSIQFTEKGRAIDKAESAQKDYNARSNEFRGQLDDQAKTLMPRIEALGKFEDVNQRLATRIKDADKAFDDLRKEISLLREIHRQEVGNRAGWKASGNLIIGVASVISVLILLATTIVTIALFVSRPTPQQTIPVQVQNTEQNKVPVRQ